MLFGSEGEDIDNASVTNLKLTIEETNNIVNEAHGGYDNVSLYIPIAQPGAHTLAKLAALQPSTISGDRMSLSFWTRTDAGQPWPAIEGIICAVEEQETYLAKKPSWTRKMVLVTDGESPINPEGWEMTAEKITDCKISLAIL
jgi:ATP-dependent DNA helicase 2 subunit 2